MSSDEELHMILSHLRPVLRPSGWRDWGGEAVQVVQVLNRFKVKAELVP
jgi:hypothetical protein